MDSDEPPAEPTSSAAIVVQLTALVAVVGYAALGLLQGVPLDRWVLVLLAGIGIGARPETLLALIRKATGT